MMSTTAWIDLGVVLMFVGMEIYYYFKFLNFEKDINGRLENIESMLYGMNEEAIQDDPSLPDVDMNTREM